jgi:hypothetical protein
LEIQAYDRSNSKSNRQLNYGVINHTGSFLARTSKDGRIIIPKINIDLPQDKKIDLAGYVVDVTLEPI